MSESVSIIRREGPFRFETVTYTQWPSKELKEIFAEHFQLLSDSSRDVLRAPFAKQRKVSIEKYLSSMIPFWQVMGFLFAGNSWVENALYYKALNVAHNRSLEMDERKKLPLVSAIFTSSVLPSFGVSKIDSLSAGVIVAVITKQNVYALFGDMISKITVGFASAVDTLPTFSPKTR